MVTLEKPVSYRYVKLTVESLKTGAFDSVSIREFEIRDKEETTPEKPQDPEENVALKKTAAADSTEDNSLIAAKAFDGNAKDRSSRWSSAVADAPHWIYVDLGKEMDVKTVCIFWETRKATDYKNPDRKHGRSAGGIRLERCEARTGSSEGIERCNRVG